jgi:tRNA (Thr-GGU) A37 N-methylase
MEITLRPIGIIHSPFTEKDKTPIQASRSQALGQVEIYPEFADGLKDIEALSHIYLLYVFHESQGYQLQVKPFLDNQDTASLPAAIRTAQTRSASPSSKSKRFYVWLKN